MADDERGFSLSSWSGGGCHERMKRKGRDVDFEGKAKEPDKPANPGS